MSRLKDNLYVEKKYQGGPYKSKGETYSQKRKWFDTFLVKPKGNYGFVTLGFIVFPAEMIGKRVRIKVEVI